MCVLNNIYYNQVECWIEFEFGSENKQRYNLKMNGSCSVIGIACGSAHSAALLDNGMVLTWGRGEDGQLGHGDAEDRTTPTVVAGLQEVQPQSIVCGAEFMAVLCKQEPQVYSWGWGDFGRLGHGNNEDSLVPRPLPFFTDKVIVQVCCGDSHTVIVTQGGELFTCGRNQNGQLGLGHSFDQFNPNPVPALKNKRIKEAACGAEHTIAVCEDGEVYGWGWGQYGNLGDGERHDRWQPTKVKGLEGIQLRQISCGWRHNLALSTEGVIYVWGWNKYGQLGVADNNDRSTAVPITSGIGQTQVISGGWRYSMSVDQNGDIYAWGWNKFGQLGLGHCEACNTPQKVSSMEGCNIELLACGWRHSMAVSRNGDFYVWGRGSYGRLGLGDEADRMMPTQMEYLTRSNLTNENLIKMQAKSEANQIVPEEEQEFMQVP
eukprot:TRINITY_DN12734_c0_g1_i2.p1 TRINITY_DN12734_c0_g1~~TRINITY_DN12734_c0_g1_i2.p1  ORF type:complete len:432 (-),score=48.71 TRINITY_DN12734_c0_g1_i2:202-1497(-)